MNDTKTIYTLLVPLREKKVLIVSFVTGGSLCDESLIHIYLVLKSEKEILTQN